MLIGKISANLANAVEFGAQQNGRWFSVVHLAKITGRIGQMGRQYLKPLMLEVVARTLQRGVGVKPRPSAAPCVGRVVARYFPAGGYSVNVQYAHRITAANDSGDIVGLVDSIGQNGQVGLASGEGLANQIKTVWSHERGAGCVPNRLSYRL